ncbi:MAG: hypothetical protein DRP64_00535 [Verrucomicrobia bacterium]|nr:MAG: hypothetical protein DRP64_00535 [Verrucomicrobiota bacterium]
MQGGIGSQVNNTIAAGNQVGAVDNQIVAHFKNAAGIHVGPAIVHGKSALGADTVAQPRVARFEVPAGGE